MDELAIDLWNGVQLMTNRLPGTGSERVFWNVAESCPRMDDMRNDESYPSEDTARRKAPKRTWVYGILLIFVIWLVLANHVIIVRDDFSVVVLQKTSWTFDGGFIGESNWAAFTLHHPILMSRLTAGQGFWVIGE